ncbi:MAG TPA: VOC family protein, partial [Burkholderiales bacterium]|nr:VOC family protein [Burkholderiales bacterium]
PCIHHFAIEVDDVAGCTAGLRKYGCEIISDPGVIPVKFRGPDGIVAEIVPAERYKKPKRSKK